MKKTTAVLAALALVVGVAGIAFSHCEVPCGIYNDKMRVVQIREDLTTIEKSMKQIVEIGAAEKPNWNQLVRWIDNKEKHAGKVQEIVTQYFMTQRVKVPAEAKGPGWDRYVTQLTSLHRLLVTAMKTKQTTDLANVEACRSHLDAFVNAYFSEEDRKHLEEHE